MTRDAHVVVLIFHFPRRSAALFEEHRAFVFTMSPFRIEFSLFDTRFLMVEVVPAMKRRRVEAAKTSSPPGGCRLEVMETTPAACPER